MNFKKNIINIPGYRINRRIIIIESDDWGSIRMPSKEVYYSLLKKGIRVDNCPYCKYDSLASEEDLSALFEVLTSFKDKNGNHPIITANTVVTNPNFDRIKASGFQEYYYEPFIDTLKKYPNHNRSFELWRQGIKSNIFHPQFHGREHLNVPLWMNCLLRDHKETLNMFTYNTWGGEIDIPSYRYPFYMAGFDYSHKQEEDFIKESIKDGMNIFEQLFHYRSKTFIANCYIWNDFIEKTLYEAGVEAIQGSIYQTFPLYTRQILNKKGRYHFMGQKNKFGQRYLIRNCYLEPSQYPQYDNVDRCLKSIEIAFKWHKPAIISMHRLNVIGSICKNNQDRGLKSLKRLLTEVIKKWPDVEFLASDDLADLFINTKQ
ncbi:hypothetical protein LJC57_05710 [Parabacteroides sp. OttesenSCG-928-G07]|nr:hypothetical protein [Parabacteroides sp. OttesenSCG-928-G21]MDL2278070.1 hypothetical protein [Parabacteroides sp. OttesenSCG-928-G07]